jgi:uncharacterized protein (DUF58 family)
VSRWPRPARPRSPIFAAAGVVVIWWVVAHNGGAGWVQFVGDLVFGTLLVGTVGPAVVVGRVRLQVHDAPADAVAGRPVEVHVVASSRVRVRPVEPPGDEAFVGPAGRNGRVDLLTLVPPRRGLHRTLTLDLASAAPFALQWWTRRVTLALPRELHVSPRRGRPDRPRTQSHEQRGAIVVRPRADTGLPRGARPYRSGDSRQRVHWRATAHARALMVRDVERPAGQPVVVVDLPADPDEAERIAERALGTVVALLADDGSVLLETQERTGPVTASVGDRRAAGRRLARAVPSAGGQRGGLET